MSLKQKSVARYLGFCQNQYRLRLITNDNILMESFKLDTGIRTPSLSTSSTKFFVAVANIVEVGEEILKQQFIWLYFTFMSLLKEWTCSLSGGGYVHLSWVCFTINMMVTKRNPKQLRNTVLLLYHNHAAYVVHILSLCQCLYLK